MKRGCLVEKSHTPSSGVHRNLRLKTTCGCVSNFGPYRVRAVKHSISVYPGPCETYIVFSCRTKSVSPVQADAFKYCASSFVLWGIYSTASYQTQGQASSVRNKPLPRTKGYSKQHWYETCPFLSHICIHPYRHTTFTEYL